MAQNNIFSYERDDYGADEIHWFYDCTLKFPVANFKAGQKFYCICLNSYSFALDFFLEEVDFEAYKPTMTKMLSVID